MRIKKPELAESINHPKIPLRDHRSSEVLFLNPLRKSVTKIKVDGVEITEGKRCDWCLIYDGLGVYFIELKAGPSGTAFEQLEATLVAYNADRCTTFQFSCVVVSTGPGSISDRTSRAKWAEKLRRQYRAKVYNIGPSRSFDLNSKPQRLD